MSDMKLAENITVDATGILIDGRRLPYWLAPNDIQVQVQMPTDGGLSEITFSMLAESISVSASMEVEGDGYVDLIHEPNYTLEEAQ